MSSYESIYHGISYQSALPSYYNSPIKGYQENIRNIGMAVDPRTANQLGELNIKLNPGTKIIEIQGITPQTFESIPEQHLDEMKRLSKLTGVKTSLHGPMLEASGIVEGYYTDENRFGVEKQIESTVLRANKLDPEGNISVTFHSTAQLPEMRPHIKKNGEKIEEGIFIINEDTGQINRIRPQERYLEDGKKFTGEQIKSLAKKELERLNKDTWTESISQINRMTDAADERIDRAKKFLPEELYTKIGKVDTSLIKDENFKIAQRDVETGHVYLRDAYRGMKSNFDKAWSNVRNEEDKKKLREFAEETSTKITGEFEGDIEKIGQLKEVVEKGLKILSNIKNPEIYKPLDEFVIKKSAETFANVAEKAYNKFGDKAPIINIENPPAGGGLSTGEDLKELIKASRKQLSENLTKKGYSKSESNHIAEKMIGATWDVGHINMLRKKGYSEKDIIEETKKIAPYVKHVHLSDNFGLDHTELPMGMGNVPLKSMMEELKKAGFKGKEIIEAGNWWQYFADKGGGSPFLPSIEAFNSPIYGMKDGPTWAQTGFYGAYFSGHGSINPPVHHNVYGAGFQTLPIELGGEIPGDKGRFAGTPNQ